MPKKYIVRLMDAEREMLNGLIKQRRVAAQKVLRAHVLLKADADGPHWTDAAIANAFDCRTQTIESVRERFVTEGFEIALHGTPKRRWRGKVLDGMQEAKIIALRLGPPPPGCANWTLRLLAEHAVALGASGVGEPRDPPQDLKKNHFTTRKIEYWVNSPTADAEFAASMEEVLEVYANPPMRGIRCSAWMSNQSSS